MHRLFSSVCLLLHSNCCTSWSLVCNGHNSNCNFGVQWAQQQLLHKLVFGVQWAQPQDWDDPCPLLHRLLVWFFSLAAGWETFHELQVLGFIVLISGASVSAPRCCVHQSYRSSPFASCEFVTPWVLSPYDTF